MGQTNNVWPNNIQHQTHMSVKVLQLYSATWRRNMRIFTSPEPGKAFPCCGSFTDGSNSERRVKIWLVGCLTCRQSGDHCSRFRIRRWRVYDRSAWMSVI